MRGNVRKIQTHGRPQGQTVRSLEAARRARRGFLCLSVYTEAGWQSILDKYNALPISQARKMRFLFANAAKCEPDKQGRFLIPTELRQYAGIRQEVTFIGQGGHAEIWDSEAYDKLEMETLTPENLAQVMEELGF